MPATAIPEAGVPPGIAAAASSIGPRRSPARDSSSIAVGGSEAMWRSVWRTTPACRETWKSISEPVPTIELGRAAADVDDQRRLAGRILGGGAEVGEAGLLAAVEHLRREGEALAQLGDEGVAVGGVADGARRDRHDVGHLRLLVQRHVVGDRLARRLDRLRRELSGEVDAAAEPGHAAAPLDLGDPAAGDVGDQEAGRVRADVDDGDPVGVGLHGRGTLVASCGHGVASMGGPSRGGAAR